MAPPHTTKGNQMVRKLSLICAVAGALLFPVTTFAEDHDHGQQQAHQQHNHDQQQGHQQHDHDQRHDHDYDHEHHAHDYDHDHHHDNDHQHHHDHAHWYHGHYWEYGVGPCWRPAPVGFVWICGY